MRTLLPLFVLLSLAATARADVAVPGVKRIPREVRVTFAEPYPGHTFFVVCRDTVKPVPTAAGEVNLSELVGITYWSSRIGMTLYAVPDDMLADLGSAAPDGKWFEANAKNPRLRAADMRSTEFGAFVTDPRERIIQTYRVTLTPTAVETELVSEQSEQGWGVWVCGGVCLALTCGFVSLSVWLIRRLFRRSITRTAPPPETTPEANLDQANGAT